MTRKPTDSDAQWYKDAVIYELHVRAFSDSNDDGIGDFKGLTAKLDYLQDLGVTSLWLLPFYPSPLRDDGYDIANYFDINPSYGTLADFEAFLAEAHRRGLRVITELVLNHTSDQHAWFERARRAPPGSAERNFYVWRDAPDAYLEARIIFKDFETSNWAWDAEAKQYYWHRFFSHQPDLNFDNPAVHDALFEVVDFWLGKGVDGLRLDAVPYLYERESTNCENLPETHAFLRKLRAHIDRKFEGRMLLGEANQWPEDSVAYFGSGDECHMNFHFPVMPRLYMALHGEDSFPIVDILEQTPAIPPSSQWATFLRNHDELTLEMVTEEERDVMYRVYAPDPRARINLGIRRRLAPLLGSRSKVELLNALLFALPGTPVVYYGDEIGMGDNIALDDRNGVRTPMQWNGDSNAGFSRAAEPRLYLPLVTSAEYRHQAINVAAQRANPSSLWWWMKRLIALRKQCTVLGRGAVEFLKPVNQKVLVFLRTLGDQRVLVVANLSRFAQPVQLDLSAYQGLVPVELFGGARFPRIGPEPYGLSLGPHSFYWLALEATTPLQTVPGLPTVQVGADWREILTTQRQALEACLPAYLQRQRWFGGKTRHIKSTRLADVVAIGPAAGDAQVVLVEVGYEEEGADTYFLPLAFVTAERTQTLESEQPTAVICRLRFDDGRSGVVVDATVGPAFGAALLAPAHQASGFAGLDGRLAWSPAAGLAALWPEKARLEAPQRLSAEQSNTSLSFGSRLLLKLYRRLEAGIHPEPELGRYLTERRFKHVAPLAAALEYRRPQGESSTVGVLFGYVPQALDAWHYSLDAIHQGLARGLAKPGVTPTVPSGAWVSRLDEEPPELARQVIGSYLSEARLLGERTAALHLALAADKTRPELAPEPFTELYQRGLYQASRAACARSVQLLRQNLTALSADAGRAAEQVLGLEKLLQTRLRVLLGGKLAAVRQRIHGDYHLGQVLYAGGDFVIIDFEGEPSRSLSARRLKRSPLVDVAGMLRSFHYASVSALQSQVSRVEDAPVLAAWARFWYAWVGHQFLTGYLKDARRGGFLPSDPVDLAMLLDVCLLDKANYELEYELNHRPDWVHIPLRGLLDLLASFS